MYEPKEGPPSLFDKQWMKKVEKALGTSYWDARSKLSRDQIIGIFRELDFGKDPHKSERIGKMQELADSVSIFRTSPDGFYRDTIDESLWSQYMSGMLQYPKNKRKFGKITGKDLEESLKRYQERLKKNAD